MLEVNREICVGAGMCVLTAPDFFDQDDSGVVMPLPGTDGPRAASASEDLRQAVLLCPSGALGWRGE